jgi:hypothetical protein
MRLETRGGVEVEGCLHRGGDGWREQTAKVKRKTKLSEREKSKGLCKNKKATGGFFNLSNITDRLISATNPR